MDVLKQLGDRLFLSNKVDTDSPTNSYKENLFAGPNSIQQFLQAQEANDRSSGYGGHHSGYGGHHSGYGHSGHSGFGGYSHGFGYNDCCPLVFDPLTLISFFGFLAAGTYLLQITITMTIMGRRKKRNISEKFQDILFAGRKKSTVMTINIMGMPRSISNDLSKNRNYDHDSNNLMDLA